MPIDKGDTAWVLICTAFVLLMTAPGLALFYGGMVRQRNVLGTLLQSFVALALISIQWVLFGYSLAFGPDHGGLIGGLEWAGLRGVGPGPSSYAPTIPHQAFMLFQMMFAAITPALITGAFAERKKFAAFLLFTLLWATFVYDPLAHWVWAEGGFLRKLGALDFAGGTVVHLSSGTSALVCALVIGKRKGYPKTPMPPHNLPLTLIGAGLLWFGWFGFNAGSALEASGGKRIPHHQHRGGSRSPRLDVRRVDRARKAHRARHGLRGGSRAGGHHPRLRLRGPARCHHHRSRWRSAVLQRLPPQVKARVRRLP
jgi:Amt family ammonium transporter